MLAQADSPGWHADLRLRFEARAGATRIAERAHRGPLVVQRAFHPEGAAPCHVYLLHPPGGLVGGDALSIQVAVDGGAHALVTTPAAGKVYRSAGAVASQRATLSVAAGAALEWLPQETIVYDGAHVTLETVADLALDARFAGWEILCLGRPAAGERFDRGWCRQRLEVRRDGRPLCIERARLDGGGAALAAPWGLREAPVSATMIVSPVPDGALAAARAVGSPKATLTSVTAVEGALICRQLGASAARAREHFTRLWAALRPALLGRPAVPPRIWST